jgi:secreted PhoX family phosphatase
MGKGYDSDAIVNEAGGSDLMELLAVDGVRRRILKVGLLGGVLAALPGCATRVIHSSGTPEKLLGFAGVPVSVADAVTVPAGYRAQVLYAWGDAIGSAAGQPAFKWDASNTAGEQTLQAGMHHDAIEYFPLPQGSGSADHALLAINHEYTDDGMLHPGGMANWSAEKVRKSQMASGASVVEVQRAGGQWQVVRPSRHARRITAQTPIAVSGPAAGHALLRTAADPAGMRVLGTINNCAGGLTPWGTYLTCEENFNGYFANAGTIPADQRRYGISALGAGYRWHEHDARFDANAHPNEPNRFGWVVEIDPYDPQSMPVKRTALGRVKHEGATVALARDGRVVVYMGDDERFEYIYKFVSSRPYDAANRAANRTLLDEGTLHVAFFNDSGAGTWIELKHGENGLTAANGFASQAEILIRTRQAADFVGATKMDRPEWTAVHPVTKDVYVTLTNNDRRGTEGQPGVNAVNPRAGNVFGHIVKWTESGGDPAALHFSWETFVLAGDPAHPDPAKRGNIKGDVFGSPDGLWFDKRGVLWIETDVSTSVLNRGDYARMGNNQLLAADLATGEVRRFLTGPAGCELTGCTMAPDGRTLFVNIQHPGETASERTDPAQPRGVSNWPDFRPDGRPRSATLAIRREDGGLIGS